MSPLWQFLPWQSGYQPSHIRDMQSTESDTDNTRFREQEVVFLESDTNGPGISQSIREIAFLTQYQQVNMHCAKARPRPVFFSPDDNN